MAAGEQSGDLLPDGLPIGSGCAPA